LDLDSNVIVESKDAQDIFYNDSKTISDPTQTLEIDLNPSLSQENKRKKS
jgi:hypothetical protein